MAKRTNHYYVLVFTNKGPVYVTNVNYMNSTAKWDKLETPLEFSKTEAEELCVGLQINNTSAVVVMQSYEITSQPYYYSMVDVEIKDKN